MTKIAIIMPVYNGEQYLNEAITSVLNQSFEDFQLICVNDSSTDNSFNILNEFAQKDKRVKVLTKENGGPGEALNYGIKNSESEYLCFIDQDDKYHKDYLKLMYQTISSFKIKLVLCRANYWYPENGKLVETDFVKLNDNCIDISSLQSKKQLKESYFPQWAKIIERKFFEDNHIKFPNRANKVHDVPVHFELLYNTDEIAVVNIPIYWHRVHSDQISYQLTPTIGYLNSYKNLLEYANLLNGENRKNFLNFALVLIDNSFENDSTMKNLLYMFSYFYDKKMYSAIKYLLKLLILNNKVFSIVELNNKKIFKILGIKLSLKKRQNVTSLPLINPLILKHPEIKNLGRNSYYSSNLVIVSPKTSIGSFCSFGDNVILGNGEHPQNFLSTSPYFYFDNLQYKDLTQISHNEYWIVPPITIENDVWIGNNVFVKNGVTIGNGAIIGANSIVTKDVEPYSIVAGSPAKHIRYRFSENIIKDLLSLKWWNLEDEQIKKIPYDNIDKAVEYLKTQINR